MSIKNGHTDKVAVVTGGGSGLGLACARRLAGQGFRVHALGKDLEIDLGTEPTAARNAPAFTFTDFDVTASTCSLTPPASSCTTWRNMPPPAFAG